ncbi:MerR family transcriptional regulator [Lentisphaerota bacterium ZTH]|nr:MerR family transcriptional regulator [Lentisphaerota bacterium]WET06933.1 MerR family transcriptional regulator [Lentisphaerota bacterium ZTH]
MFNIDYLAKKAGVTRRTVRYYIQRGLLPPPLGRKRGAYYTDAHYERLQLILKLSAKGVPLFQIKRMLDSNSTSVTEGVKVRYPRKKVDIIELTAGVELMVRENIFDDEDITIIKKYILQLLKEKQNDQ